MNVFTATRVRWTRSHLHQDCCPHRSQNSNLSEKRHNAKATPTLQNSRYHTSTRSRRYSFGLQPQLPIDRRRLCVFACVLLVDTVIDRRTFRGYFTVGCQFLGGKCLNGNKFAHSNSFASGGSRVAASQNCRLQTRAKAGKVPVEQIMQVASLPFRSFPHCCLTEYSATPLNSSKT